MQDREPIESKGTGETVELPVTGLLDRFTVLLFLDWFGLLLRQRLGVTQTGTSGKDNWHFKVSDMVSITARLLPDATSLVVMAPSDFGGALPGIAEEARRAAIRRDISPSTWWSASLEAKPSPGQQSMLHMLRNLGTFRRFEGRWRLGRTARLEFTHEGDPAPAFFPKFSVHIIFRTPGAAAGPFAREVAVGLLPHISSVVSFSVGTPTQLFPTLLPAGEEEAAEVEQELSAGALPELHVDGFPTWSVLDGMVRVGAIEAARRGLGALGAYEEAMLQRTQHSSMLFFVSAIEALTVPNLPQARHHRLHKRFCEYLLQFCPDALQTMMAHANFRDAFGDVRTPEDLVDILYTARSEPVHTGHFGEFVNMIALESSARVGLVSDLARSAILTFLRCPVTLLWGHPTLDPSIRVPFNGVEYVAVQAAARAARVTVEEWIRQRAVEAAG